MTLSVVGMLNYMGPGDLPGACTSLTGEKEDEMIKEHIVEGFRVRDRDAKNDLSAANYGSSDEESS